MIHHPTLVYNLVRKGAIPGWGGEKPEIHPSDLTCSTVRIAVVCIEQLILTHKLITPQCSLPRPAEDYQLLLQKQILGEDGTPATGLG